MTRNSWIILCLAYIVGLLSTNLFTFSSSGFTKPQFLIIALGLIGLAFINAIALRRLLRISSQFWIGAAIVAILAVVYFQLRLPQPTNNDISYQVSASESELVTVAGRVLTEPRLNDNQRLKFWLQATEIDNGEEVSGKLYVTVPLLQGTGINPGEYLKLKGILYLPQAASNPGGFNFQAYLARQGIFAGLQGLEVIFDNHNEPAWGWWKLRRRIVRSHVRGLSSPIGQMTSSMVLGRKAVDLSSDIRDRFIEAGLAHVLAASGFHVSLLLGIILKLTNRFSTRLRLVIGIGTLIIYLGLTGIQASVFRACLMGFAVLLALAMDTRVKPLGSLLLAATIILLVNPLLIGDLGFQLSFLATFGLIVTLPGLQTKLDWLPPTIATLIAVPLAASVWVFPMLGYVFNSVATYSILVNICCTPLIIIISLGGMISAIAALFVPLGGSAIAWLLVYPAKTLLVIINFFTNLPGSSWAIGQISLGVLLTIYGLFLLVWLHSWWRKRWWLILLCTLTLIVVPRVYQYFNLTQVIVLAAQPEPAIVIQDRDKVILINSGNPKTVKYSLLPFLTQQGINRLDYAIDLNQTSPAASDWSQISDRLTIDHFLPNLNSDHQFAPTSQKTVIQDLNRAITTKSCQISFDSQLSLLKLETVTETWLLLSQIKRDTGKIKQYIQQSHLNQKPVVLVSSKFPTAWLELQPNIIISSANSQKIIPQHIPNTKLYNLKRDGAITWSPKQGFKSSTERSQSNYIF